MKVYNEAGGEMVLRISEEEIPLIQKIFPQTVLMVELEGIRVFPVFWNGTQNLWERFPHIASCRTSANLTPHTYSVRGKNNVVVNNDQRETLTDPEDYSLNSLEGMTALLSRQGMLNMLCMLDVYEGRVPYRYFMLGNSRRVCTSRGNRKSRQRVIGRILSHYLELFLAENIDLSNSIVAYRPNISYINPLKSMVSPNFMYTFDLVKYFDNITKDAFTEGMALMGHHQVVNDLWSFVKDPEGQKGIQQGSHCSPAVANISGLSIDTAILQYIKSLGRNIRYMRYSDNLYLLGFGKATMTRNETDVLKNIVRGAGYALHKEVYITNNHPKYAQRVLGLVVNNSLKRDNKQNGQLDTILFKLIISSQSDFDLKMNELKSKFGKETVEQVMAVLSGQIHYLQKFDSKRFIKFLFYYHIILGRVETGTDYIRNTIHFANFKTATTQLVNNTLVGIPSNVAKNVVEETIGGIKWE